MKIIILGQPRSGKSTLAKILSDKLNIPVICTDKYRREWGYHEPWKGYDTEISPLKQKEFYDKLIDIYNSYESLILEGSAINPDDLDLFKYDDVVLLYKNISSKEMLELCRKYDNDWTTRRDDKYLLELFDNYISYSLNWVNKHKDISVDTTNYFEGLEQAQERILKKVNFR